MCIGDGMSRLLYSFEPFSSISAQLWDDSTSCRMYVKCKQDFDLRKKAGIVLSSKTPIPYPQATLVFFKMYFIIFYCLYFVYRSKYLQVHF